jgi:hypothetical protein
MGEKEDFYKKEKKALFKSLKIKFAFYRLAGFP